MVFALLPRFRQAILFGFALFAWNSWAQDDPCRIVLVHAGYGSAEWSAAQEDLIAQSVLELIERRESHTYRPKSYAVGIPGLAPVEHATEVEAIEWRLAPWTKIPKLKVFPLESQGIYSIAKIANIYYSLNLEMEALNKDPNKDPEAYFYFLKGAVNIFLPQSHPTATSKERWNKIVASLRAEFAEQKLPQHRSLLDVLVDSNLGNRHIKAKILADHPEQAELALSLLRRVLIQSLSVEIEATPDHAKYPLETARSNLLNGGAIRSAGVFLPHLVGIWKMVAEARAMNVADYIDRHDPSSSLEVRVPLDTWMIELLDEALRRRGLTAEEIRYSDPE